MKKLNLFLAIAASLVAVAVGARPALAQRDFVVIVNPANPVSRLTTAQLSKIYLRKLTAWDMGGGATEPVVPIDLRADAPARDVFSRRVLRRPVDAVKSFWRQEVFAGREVPPQEQSEAEAVAFVRREPGAIAYVPAGTDTKGVKVVPIL